MADSDNTTTLPLVTRRAVLVGAAVAVAASDQSAVADRDGDARSSSDPSLAVWRRWQLAHRQTERLCRKQQRLERTLLETVGFPRADDPLHKARWHAADKEVGYSAALNAEHVAADRAEALLELLCETPARSLAGVAAKLHAVMTEEAPSEHDSAFPWPLIRSARNDLIHMAESVEPNQNSRGN